MYGVELKLLLAIASHESRFNPKALNINKGKSSKKSADRGIMQINSCWIPTLKKYAKADIRTALYNPDYNIKVGAWVLKQCLNRYGNTWRAVDCYNKGAKKARNSSRYINKIWEEYKKIPDDIIK